MKRSVYSPLVVALLFAFLAAGPFAGSAFAQIQNPLQAAKDAYNRAKAQLQAQTPTTGQPASQQTAPGSPQTAPGSQPASGNQLAVPGAFSSSLLTPAPPGGLDPSKLPDLLGIHIGEPTDQAVAEIQKLYPVIRNDHGTLLWGLPSVPYNKYPFANAPPYVSTVAVVKPNTAGCFPATCQARDRIDAIFSGPPEKRVVQLKRDLTFDVGKTPTSDTLKNALIQKYGPNFVETSGLTLTWQFDETGKPMPPLARSVALTGCQGIVSNGGGVPGGLPSYLGVPITQKEPQQDLDRIVKVRCGMQIQVVAWINGTPGGTANSLLVTVSEIAADMRAAFAAENYLWQLKSAQSNQQLKNAQQQAAPTF
jgi:hypothetical protein